MDLPGRLELLFLFFSLLSGSCCDNMRFKNNFPSSLAMFFVCTTKTVSLTSFYAFVPRQQCVYMHLVLRLFNMPIKLEFSPLSADQFRFS
jgi:hypothetical protein